MNNKVKIAFREPRYSVHKDKGVVVCNCPYVIMLPDIIDSICWDIRTKFYSGVVLNAKGVARIKGDDSFDESLGKKIAYTKAQNKAYKYVDTCLHTNLVKLIKVRNAIWDNRDSIEEIYKHNEDYLKSL